MPGQVTSPGMPAQVSGAPALASNALPIGTRIGEFEITRVIGEGGFSVVYLAFDHTLHRSIALKEYIPSALASRRGDQTVAVRSAQHLQTFEAGLRSFINEARLLAQFDHPALVKVYRFWEGNGTAYMAMPYYEGRTLREILREHPEQANEAWLKRLLVPLLDALSLLHEHHCYHRDIAPDNIQVLDNEAPVLLDFGAARRTIGDMTQAFTVILKPGYAPIEQYAEETDLKQGPWTDVYALSAVLYGAIVGKPPPTAVARVIKDPLEPLASRALPGFDPMFLSGIDRGLAVRPEARPQSIAEWRGLLGMERRPAAAREAASRAMPSLDRRGTSSVHPVDEPAESDRTVLVPGLRRSPPRAADAPSTLQKPDPAPARSVASDMLARDGRPSRNKTVVSMRSRVIAIVAAVAVVAVIGWLVVAKPFGEREAPAVVAKAADSAASSSTAAATSSPPSLPLPATPQSRPPQAEVRQTPPAQAEVPQTPPPQTQVPQTSARALAQSPQTQATGPQSPQAESPPETAAPKPKAPPVPEDERRWAAVRNSDSIDDLRAFRQRFPQSPHAQDAAVRIQQLVRQSRENAREAASPAQPPAASMAKAEQQAGPRARSDAAAGAAAASSTSTGTVRIRVQPFGYVYVDGALVGPSPPARDVQLAPGKHRIEARNDQENPPVIRREIDVTAAGSTEVPLRFRE